MTEKIGQSFYNNTSYFSKLSKKLDNLEHPLQKFRIKKILELYKPKRSDRILDLGCGWGTFSFVLAPLCKEIVGVDFSKKSIELCQSKLQKTRLKNVRFLRADAQRTGLPAGFFDCIVGADLFEHLYPEQSENIVVESRRLLKKGGKLVIWTPHRGHFIEHLKNNNIILSRDISHVDYKSMDVLVKTLEKNGFEVLISRYYESHLPVLKYLERLFLPVVPLFRRRIGILARKT